MPLLKGRKLNECPGTLSDNYSNVTNLFAESVKHHQGNMKNCPNSDNSNRSDIPLNFVAFKTDFFVLQLKLDIKD